MYSENKEKYIRYAVYALIIFFAVIFQTREEFLPSVFGARAFLLLPLSISIAMHERELPAAVFGALCGALWDLTAASEGYNTLVLMALCVCSSLFISRIMRNNIVTSFVLGGSAVAVYEILYFVLNILPIGTSGSFRLLISFYLPCFIYTVIFIPVFYLMISQVNKSFKDKNLW